MPRKNTRPAAKKLKAKREARMKSGARRVRRPQQGFPTGDHGFAMGLAMAALGARAISGLAASEGED